MNISALFQSKTLFSFEIFPPKRTSPIETIYQTLDGLKDLKPDFISVTYGAGGSENSDRTFQIASEIKKSYGIESVAHLPCIGLTRADAERLLDQLRAMEIENILALRGDIPEGFVSPGEFHHASDLITFIRERGNFDIIAACYPEGHIECSDMAEDLRNLKRKVDAGASHLITQLFFDNGHFYSFLDRCRSMGIHVPVEAGVMPVTNVKQIERMVSMCGATIPKKLSAMMDKYQHDPNALREAGIDYSIEQITDLVSKGVDGVHLYTMNNPYVARKIYDAVHGLFEA